LAKNGQRRRSEIEATLQQGLQLRAERSAAGQFWTFTMSNSGCQASLSRKASSFAEIRDFDAEPRMHVTFTRVASREKRVYARLDALWRVITTIASSRRHAHPIADVARATLAKTLCLESLVGPSGPSCLVAEGFWPAAG
jgi:hypothetical protein